MTRVVNIAQSGGNNVTMRNRVINGNMMIDQRNAGASVTATDTSNGVYVVDRWNYRVLAASKISLQQSTVAPPNFVNSLAITSLSAYTIGSGEFLNFRQSIEGFNTADFGWGTANAQSVTLSFWVRSSLTGTFGGAVINSNDTRAYVFSYTINSANTWEQKTITITGDTAGTWLTNNGAGLTLTLSVGAGSSWTGTAGSWGGTLKVAPTGQTNLAGTNGATFYITGVQLEAGTTATPFEQRLYGTELALCQRYYWKNKAGAIYTYLATAVTQTSGTGTMFGKTPVSMRSQPSVAINSVAIYGGSTIVAVTGLSNNYSSVDQMTIDISGTGFTPTTAAVGLVANGTTSAYIELNAEL